MRLPLRPALGAWLVLALAAAIPGACNGSSGSGSDAGGDATTESGTDDAAEPVICTEFTEAGAACPAPSPVRCFPECTTGGCSCMATAQGPRWVCTTDLSCIPDCAPIDDGCASVPIGDDGGGDETVGDDGGGEAGDGSDAGAADSGGVGDAGDASDASG